MATKKQNTYVIQANLTLQIGVEVNAENLEQAVAKANELKEDSFVEILGEYQDGNLEISGAYKI